MPLYPATCAARTAVQEVAGVQPPDLALMDVSKSEDNLERDISVFWEKKYCSNPKF